MKVALINGQNHKGSTYHIGRLLAEKITKPEEITEIFLPGDMPHFCCGCTQCFMKGEENCPHYTDLLPLTEIMDAAQVLIFTSPVYVYHATGSMKAFLDHYGYRWMVHRPYEGMFHKQAVVISTAAGAGMRSACRDITDSCFYWGIAGIYTYGTAVAATSWERVSSKKRKAIEKKTDVLAAKVKRRAGHIKPGIKTRLFFHFMKLFMKLLQKRGWNETDISYWKARGWNGSKKPW